MKLSDIKSKMLKWHDYYGGDIMQRDKIEKAKTRLELFSDGKKAKKEFYKNYVYWPTLFLNDKIILKKVSERDITGKLK